MIGFIIHFMPLACSTCHHPLLPSPRTCYWSPRWSWRQRGTSGWCPPGRWGRSVCTSTWTLTLPCAASPAALYFKFLFCWWWGLPSESEDNCREHSQSQEPYQYHGRQCRWSCQSWWLQENQHWGELLCWMEDCPFPHAQLRISKHQCLDIFQ